MDQVGALRRSRPLPQGIHDQGDVALLQVADAAVDKLGRAARGALAKSSPSASSTA